MNKLIETEESFIGATNRFTRKKQKLEHCTSRQIQLNYLRTLEIKNRIIDLSQDNNKEI